MEEKTNKQFFTWLLQDLCKVGKLDTSKLFSGGGEEETEGKEEKVTVGKLRLVNNWEVANKEESVEVKREVVKVNPKCCSTFSLL